jgi:GH24 family phage-related lysozyme (muramidase)
LTEKLELKVYPDPKTRAEPYSCGYGSTRNLKGKPWVMGQSCTEAEAEWMLMRDVGECDRSLSGSIPHWKDLGFALQSALLSLAYNTGYYFEDGKHDTLDQLLKQRQWRDIPKQLLAYRDDDHIEGDRGVELGVARRRLGEAYLCKGYSPKDAKKKAWEFDSVAEILEAIA